MRRAFLPVTLTVALALALLLGCSGGDDDGQSDVAGPSPVTDAVSTSAITSAVVSLATTTPTTAPPATEPPTAPPTTPVPSPPPAGPASGPYAPVDAPAFPTRSAPPPSGDPWPDGDYYVVVRGAGDAPTPRLAVTVYQLLSGSEAIAAAQADGVGLDSDVYIPPDPAADRDIELTADLPISVARPDRPGVSYAITAGELARLVSGAAPEEGAPDGYGYVEFPFLLTVQGGRPAALQQLWAP